MTLYKATAEGNVPMTAEEEAEFLANRAADAPTIDQIKSMMWKAIKAERDRRSSGGVKVGAKWFHTDDRSRIQQLGILMMGANIPEGLQWKTMDGSFVTMTQTLINQIFATQAESDRALFIKAEQHKEAMEAYRSPETYDYKSGWPLIFGE